MSRHILVAVHGPAAVLPSDRLLAALDVSTLFSLLADFTALVSVTCLDKVDVCTLVTVFPTVKSPGWILALGVPVGYVTPEILSTVGPPAISSTCEPFASFASKRMPEFAAREPDSCSLELLESGQPHATALGDIPSPVPREVLVLDFGESRVVSVSDSFACLPDTVAFLVATAPSDICLVSDTVFEVPNLNSSERVPVLVPGI